MSSVIACRDVTNVLWGGCVCVWVYALCVMRMYPHLETSVKNVTLWTTVSGAVLVTAP